jgi:thiol-disulfide isomerase/thioredoxin
MPRFLSYLAAAALASAVASPAVFAQAPAAATASSVLTIGSMAPPIRVAQWVKGAPVHLGDGKLHVVEFWATWCGPCRVSIPHLTELSKKYAGKVDFTGVSVWEDNDRSIKADAIPAKVDKFVATMGSKMDYHVARDKDGIMAKSWMMAAAQNGIPTAFVVDGDGKIDWIGHPMGGLDETLGKIIAGKFDRTAAAQEMKAEQKAQAAQQAQQAKLDELFGPALQLAQQKKFPEAVAEIEHTLVAHPEFVGPTGYLKYHLMLEYDETAAQEFALKLSRNEWKSDASTLNAVAWAMVGDDAKMKKPDYTIAVAIAEAASAASGDKEPSILDTLAAAYDRHGDVDKAIATEQKAVSLLPADADPAMAKDLKARLALLQAKKK